MTRFANAEDAGFLAVTADLLRWSKTLPKVATAQSEESKQLASYDQSMYRFVALKPPPYLKD